MSEKSQNVHPTPEHFDASAVGYAPAESASSDPLAPLSSPDIATSVNPTLASTLSAVRHYRRSNTLYFQRFFRDGDAALLTPDMIEKFAIILDSRLSISTLSACFIKIQSVSRPWAKMLEC